jgi:hypothetical protein
VRRAWKVLLVLLLALGFYFPAVSEQVARAACGEFRWPVKTLSDADAHAVDYSAIQTKVRALRHRDRPTTTIGTSTPRTSRTEFQTWKVRARAVQAKLEDDNDIHLVISVPRHPSKTMIVEFPKKTCVASRFKRWKIAEARQQFLNNCGTVSSSSWLDLTGRITLVGVGFWDEQHGQTGVAPNAIELHPVLNLKGDCHKASTGGGGGGRGGCDASYPTICIPPPPPDLDCSDISYRNFEVVPPDDHHLDGDHDGIGCET